VALASVLAYRSVAIWLPAPIGLLALGGLRTTVARWSAHDAPDTEAPACAAHSRIPVVQGGSAECMPGGRVAAAAAAGNMRSVSYVSGA
jgi:hypothetical protein